MIYWCELVGRQRGEWKKSNADIAQGIILQFTLFLTIMKDLADDINSQLAIYGDENNYLSPALS